MPLTVYFPRKTNPDALQAFKAQLDPAITLHTEAAPETYQVLVEGRPKPAQLDGSPALERVIIPWAGIPPESLELLQRYPHLKVHNLHHNAETTAETALMLLFAAAKFIVPIDRRFRWGNWRARYAPNPAVALNGKTVLIIGFGQIGQHVARVCQAMGMNILATRRNPDAPLPDGIQAKIYASNKLPELLPLANVLMIAAPLTDETRGLIGATELKLLPKHAILVNVGRGPIVDEKALYQGLKSGKPYAAGIDVWYRYPKIPPQYWFTRPSKYPFHRLKNVVMNPHRGGGSMESESLRLTALAHMLNAIARGEPVPDQVDLHRGY